MLSLRGLVMALAALLLVASPTRADPVVEDGLQAFLTFDETSGTTSTDLTGNGHDAELVQASFGSGFVNVSGSNGLIRVTAGPELRSSSFTYDLWFEAGSTSGHGRIMGQAAQVGGAGPDVLERSQHVALRINNQGAVFEVPTVGTRSNDGPPDHWGTCAESFHRNDGPEHLVITHNGVAKMVRIYIGLEGQPLRLCFEALYTGSYDVDSGPLAIGNLPSADRVFVGNYFQFAYYNRPLTYQVDGSLSVTGGEIHENHQAGSNAELPVTTPDAGVDASVQADAASQPDAAGQPDAAARPDAAPQPDTGPSDPSASGGCACRSSGPAPMGLVWLLLLMAVLVRARRRVL